MPLTFSPREAQPLAAGGKDLSWKEHEKAAIQFRKSIIAEREAAGEKNPESVPMVLRRTGEVRWFNLSMSYAGWLGNAEACLTGQWRVATKDEEAAELQKIAEANQAAADAKLGILAAKQAAQAAAVMAQQYMKQQSNPVAPSGEPAKQNSGKK